MNQHKPTRARARSPTFDEVLAELKYLRRDEPAATPPLAPFEPPAPQPIDGNGATLQPGTAAAAATGSAAAGGGRGGGGGGGGARAQRLPEDRSIYIDHSASTLHEGACEGYSMDGAGGSPGTPSSSSSGGGGGGGSACPFGHR